MKLATSSQQLGISMNPLVSIFYLLAAATGGRS